MNIPYYAAICCARIDPNQLLRDPPPRWADLVRRLPPVSKRGHLEPVTNSSLSCRG
jgi:hypothetical protein